VLKNQDDVTLYEKAGPFTKKVIDATKEESDSGTSKDLFAAKDNEITGRKNFDLFGRISFGEADAYLKNCRIHAASSYDGKYFSVTIRKPPDEARRVEWKCTRPLKREKWGGLKSIFDCASLEAKDWTPPHGRYLATLCDVADILFPKIFEAESKAAGLVLITGATGGGKTTVLNGLLLKYLAARFASKLNRRPHVIAVGDPVETILNQPAVKDGGAYQCKSSTYGARAIDFTLRTLGKDVDSVKDALRDALRETPTAVVISELRDTRDFKATLAFAETGQLVFATAHSTSLIDAMRKLMSLLPGAESASGRSLLAQRLKAVVHLRNTPSLKVRGLSTKVAEITLPSVWLHNSSGIRNFVSDGLASILPRGSSMDSDRLDQQRSGVLALLLEKQAGIPVH
jgi:hypothetical protein